jgi:hypothetical protein
MLIDHEESIVPYKVILKLERKIFEAQLPAEDWMILINDLFQGLDEKSRIRLLRKMIVSWRQSAPSAKRDPDTGKPPF